MKICSVCKVEKPLSEFYFRKKEGRPRCECKKCGIAAVKKYYTENTETRCAYSRKYGAEHYDERQQYSKEWRKNNPERKRATDRAWFKTNAKRNAKTKKRWNAANPDRTTLHKKTQRKNNPSYDFACKVRAVITGRLGFKGAKKSARSEALLGCPLLEFDQLVEKLFWPGMSWKNRHKWHLDHIRPCADFNLKDPEQQKLCFHFSNWQPLWADDNQIKSDRLDWTPHESRHSLPERLKPAPFIFTPQ